ncbi:MAG: nucleotidyltransferase family protein [Rhodospirillales bacterium]|nr:nucleotidyltransferase family protein [Rhodospirillales bacterium]MCB9997109.1 nucleotidyltransferase family protein [Rhodospirillales bacterium]
MDTKAAAVNNISPNQAIILAAGKGTRLKPYTDTCPKPLVEIAGKPIIDHALDNLAAAGIQKTAVNLHYMGDMLETHLSQRARPQMLFSREQTLLDTGGGLKKAMRLLDDGPFFAVSGDSFWTDTPGQPGALERMAAAWDGDKMDLLLLLQPLSAMSLTPGLGDYDIAPDGRGLRSAAKTGTHMWTSIRLCSPALFDNTPDTPFSFLDLMDRAEKQGRLYTLGHKGAWHHITTADDVGRLNDTLDGRKGAA